MEFGIFLFFFLHFINYYFYYYKHILNLQFSKIY